MIRSLQKSFRDNLVILSIILTIIFAGMNGILYFLNQSYLDQKIESENKAFLELTTHMVNENDIDVALEYVEHYTHIHAVEIEVTDEDDIMLFSSNISYRYSREYKIETTKGTYTIYMDNTDSVTVLTVNQNFIYVNITLLLIYVLAIIFLYVFNSKSTKKIQNDVKEVLQLIGNNTSNNGSFSYYEFNVIHRQITDYLEKIDLLQDQKEMNIKGLAHDVKTPLTIIYNYLDKAQKQEKPDKELANKAFQAAQSINSMVNDLIQENYNRNNHKINLHTILQKTLSNYEDVFQTKSIKISKTINEVETSWNEQDFSRIIENLCSNAYQYSKENTTLEVSLYKEKNIYLIMKSVPKKSLDKDASQLFEKGYTETNNRSKGLGLYICKLLLAPIDGTIQAESKENKFIITIKI